MLAATNNVSWTKKFSIKSKWNILFDKSPEWISFKPQLGLKVYPCYACKNMFSSKLTFQDHINRRVVIIKYKCADCTTTFTFYNRCSFLVHARRHFSMMEGQINLHHIDIHLLPAELAGFARDESIPFLYDDEEEFCDATAYVNCQFYTPDDTEMGKQIITLKPFNLVFHYTEGGNNVLLVLKQISTNIPLCKFVTQQARPPEPRSQIEAFEPEIKHEVEDDDYHLPVISKIESLNSGRHPTCTECNQMQEGAMVGHFLGENRPLDASIVCYVCKYVAPTKCSLKAHVRTHEKTSPFVCPECGKVFMNASALSSHMEEVCFHLCKNVRFRCPALKCGKLFVLPNTYAAHFTNHFQNVIKCSVCGESYACETEFLHHARTHDSCLALQQQKCLACKTPVIMSGDEVKDHVNWHLQDREGCVYIFTCKYCRSYFRSTQTYAVHKQRYCQKTDKVQPVLLNSACQFCGARMQFKEKETFKCCMNCKQINQMNIPKVVREKSTCMLCKEELTPERKKSHSKICKYNNPVVPLETLKNDLDESSSISISSDDSKNVISLDSSNDSGSPKKAKKRKRSNGTNFKSKKTNGEVVEVQPERPIIFDGTYYCKLCDYKNTERSDFHKHIVEHRDVSTSYQCMECGECFVVKPSLVRHLMHFHKIVDTEQYFTENECCDKKAIEELENNLRLGPVEHKGPVKENQCSVCLEEFEDAQSLDKHFRIHGMAFLLKKTK